MQVRNVLHAARWKCRTQKSPKFAIWAHRTTLSGYIFATKACINNRKKVLNSNTSSTYPHNMVNFGPPVAEICWRIWDTRTPANVNGFRVLFKDLFGLSKAWGTNFSRPYGAGTKPGRRMRHEPPQKLKQFC